MGFYCYTVISCGANNAEFARKAAGEHLEAMLIQESQDISRGFLGHVADGKAYAESHKGSTITYGAVGNHVDIDEVVNDLLPFFDDLWSSADNKGLLDFDHAIILVNREQTLITDVREILSKEHTDEADAECTPHKLAGKRVRKYTAPWSWHQM